MELNWELAWASRDLLLSGLQITVMITFVVMALSLVLAVPVALMRLSKLRILRIIAGIYVEFFRCTPLLVQIVYIFFALPYIGIKFPPIQAAILALTLNLTAYISEAYRAGIRSLPPGQTEAANALGMSTLSTNIFVIMPQAFRAVSPVLGSYFVGLFKDTSLVSAIAVTELVYQAQVITARTYDYFTIYTVIFIMYFLVSYPASLIIRAMENRAERRRSGRPSNGLRLLLSEKGGSIEEVKKTGEVRA